MARIQTHSVLEGLLASVALPPWFAPVELDSRFVIDGGLLSNLPIEPALTLGATAIIALDLMDEPASLHENAIGAAQRLERLIFAVLQRQAFMETELARARGVRVHHMQLRSFPRSRSGISANIESSSRLATTSPAMRLPIGGEQGVTIQCPEVRNSLR